MPKFLSAVGKPRLRVYLAHTRRRETSARAESNLIGTIYSRLNTVLPQFEELVLILLVTSNTSRAVATEAELLAFISGCRCVSVVETE